MMVLFAPLLHNATEAGPTAFLVVLGLLAAALIALYYALALPRLPQYQRDDASLPDEAQGGEQDEAK